MGVLSLALRSGPVGGNYGSPWSQTAFAGPAHGAATMRQPAVAAFVRPGPEAVLFASFTLNSRHKCLSRSSGSRSPIRQNLPPRMHIIVSWELLRPHWCHEGNQR